MGMRCIFSFNISNKCVNWCPMHWQNAVTLYHTVHVRNTSNTQTNTFSNWSKWHCAFWRYVSPAFSQIQRYFKCSEKLVVIGQFTYRQNAWIDALFSDKCLKARCVKHCMCIKSAKYKTVVQLAQMTLCVIELSSLSHFVELNFILGRPTNKLLLCRLSNDIQY